MLDKQGLSGRLDHRELLVLLVILVSKDLWVYKDQLGQLDQMDSREILELLASLERKVPLV